jgi:hypothetical protein
MFRSFLALLFLDALKISPILLNSEEFRFVVLMSHNNQSIILPQSNAGGKVVVSLKVVVSDPPFPVDEDVCSEVCVTFDTPFLTA